MITRQPIIAAQHLCHSYRSGRASVTALHDVTLEVAEHESVAIVGQSGAGKSTLTSILIGRVRPTSGRVIFRGKDVTHVRGGARRAFWQSVQMVTQDPSLAFRRRQTVASVIEEPLRNFNVVEKQDCRARVFSLLESVELPASYATRRCGELSGGEQQRLSLARALAPHPACLILDEATSALDASTQMRLIDTIGRIKEEDGLTVIAICHDLGVAQSLAERIVVMDEGTIVADIPGFELSRSQEPTVKRLVEASFSLNEPKGSMFVSGNVES